jgi:uncharacterized membrane protein
MAENVAAIAALEEAALARRSFTERVADRIARFAGSGTVAALHVVWFGGWILINTGLLAVVPAFDPYPFSFLTLVVSLEAIFLSIFVLMNQTRASREADRRAHLDLQINLLAEQESTKTIDLLHRIASHLGINVERPPEERDLTQPTDVGVLVTVIDESLPKT